MVWPKVLRAFLVVAGLGLITIGCSSPSAPLVWVADSANSRVLLIQYILPLIPIDPVQCHVPQSQPCNANYGNPVGSAIGVIGQSNFNDNSFGASQTALEFPTGIALDPSGNLWVVDALNYRVLEFSQSSISGTNFFAPKAVQVIGQPNFETTNGGSANNGFYTLPEGIAFDQRGNLFVADTSACRIMVFSSGNLGEGKANQPNATSVLGQIDFNSVCDFSSSPLGNVHQIAFDGAGNLWVAAQNGIFEFVYNMYHLPIGPGEVGFEMGQLPVQIIPTGGFLSSPFGIAIVNGNLWVSDGCNPYFFCTSAYNRVIEFAPQNGSWTNPTVISILGQGSSPPFCPGNPDNSGANSPSNLPSPRTLASPTFLAFDSTGNLFIADSDNSRVNIYSPIYATTPYLPAPYWPGTCPSIPQMQEVSAAPGTIYTGDNATFVIGQPSGYTACNGPPKLPCGPENNALAPASPTTLAQPTGIIPLQ
jgi:hypothetical protein